MHDEDFEKRVENMAVGDLTFLENELKNRFKKHIENAKRVTRALTLVTQALARKVPKQDKQWK